MNAVRCAVVTVIALAVSSAAPSAAEQPGAAGKAEDARRRAVQNYFERRADARVQAQARPNANDPKWVQSMQQLVKDLSDDNAKLRVENEGLRADNEALKRAVSAMEAKLRQLQQNRGTVVVPPGEVRSAPPEGWKPFQFNGQTYYLIPLEHGQKGDK